MEIKDVVCKLVGPIDPVGETNTDNTRFENLKVMCDLVEALVTDIDNVSYTHQGSYEYSRKRAADFAADFMTRRMGIPE